MRAAEEDRKRVARMEKEAQKKSARKAEQDRKQAAREAKQARKQEPVSQTSARAFGGAKQVRRQDSAVDPLARAVRRKPLPTQMQRAASAYSPSDANGLWAAAQSPHLSAASPSSNGNKRRAATHSQQPARLQTEPSQVRTPAARHFRDFNFINNSRSAEADQSRSD